MGIAVNLLLSRAQKLSQIVAGCLMVVTGQVDNVGGNLRIESGLVVDVGLIPDVLVRLLLRGECERLLAKVTPQSTVRRVALFKRSELALNSPIGPKWGLS